MKKTLLSLTLTLTTLLSYGQTYMGIGVHHNNNDITSFQTEVMITKDNLVYGGGILFSEQGPSNTHYNLSTGFAGDRYVGKNKTTMGFMGNVGIKVKDRKEGPMYLMFEPVISVENTRKVFYDHMNILGGSTGSRYSTNDGYEQYNTYFQAGLLLDNEDSYVKFVGGISVYGETTFGISVGLTL